MQSGFTFCPILQNKVGVFKEEESERGESKEIVGQLVIEIKRWSASTKIGIGLNKTLFVLEARIISKLFFALYYIVDFEEVYILEVKKW